MVPYRDNPCMRETERHHSEVLATPWAGIYATRTDSARHYGKHWHATWGLGLIDGGAHRSASARGSVDAWRGDLLATNPGEVHDGRPLDGPSRQWRIVYFEPAAVRRLDDAGGAQIEIGAAVLRDDVLRGALLRLLGRIERWNAANAVRTDALACEEALVEAWGLLVRRHAAVATRREAKACLQRVRERLADDLAVQPSLQALGSEAGLSRFQLLRQFRAAFGVTPHEWLLQQRAETARALVGKGLGLAEAAARAGFADQSHMTRVFRRQFGFTPGAWRSACHKLQ